MYGYIDIYCERLEPGLWAEPLNALTNLAFLIAAFFAYLCARKNNKHTDLTVKILITLLFMIGLGSLNFHLLASKSAMLSDVIPILLYQIAFIVSYAYFVMKMNPLQTAILFILFMASSAVMDMVPADILNGSVSYFPALIFLFGFGMWHRRNVGQSPYILLTATLTFMLSLTFRSVDMAFCSVWPIGTHFMWHVLNGVVLYLTTRAYIISKDTTKTI